MADGLAINNSACHVIRKGQSGRLFKGEVGLRSGREFRGAKGSVYSPLMRG